MTAREVYDFLNSLAPYDTQCEWDNSGLMAGSLETETDAVMLCLDCTNDVIEQAVANGCKLIISHHPLIFKPLKCVEADTPVYNAIKNDITVLSCHTNLDMAKDGVNDMLCRTLGIGNVQLLFAEGAPIMRMGERAEMSAKDFAAFVSGNLNNSVKLTDSGKTVKKVAVCGGAGGEYIREAVNAGCDTFVTGEAKHHEYLDAERLGINLLVAGHFSTEKTVLDALCDKLLKAFPKHKVCIAYEKCPYETVV
ncbi:MAG: Nif3-like dinuclear metal center hexameric protein [Clostridia bacterium]|nr:Nif3-like dinuclear metal center hexameric protein [Clostridia bacterium]